MDYAYRILLARGNLGPSTINKHLELEVRFLQHLPLPPKTSSDLLQSLALKT